MSNTRSSVLWLIALAVAVLYVVRLAPAAVVTLDGKGKLMDEVRLTADLSGNADNVFSVPANRRLVITDVVLRNAGLLTADVLLQVAGGDALLPRVVVKPGDSPQLRFTVGPELAGGQSLRLVDLADSNGVSYYIAGYLTK